MSYWLLSGPLFASFACGPVCFISSNDTICLPDPSNAADTPSASNQRKLSTFKAHLIRPGPPRQSLCVKVT